MRAQTMYAALRWQAIAADFYRAMLHAQAVGGAPHTVLWYQQCATRAYATARQLLGVA